MIIMVDLIAGLSTNVGLAVDALFGGAIYVLGGLIELIVGA